MHAYASQRLEAEKERREGKILRRRVTIARAHELTFPSVACSSLFDQNTLLRLLAYSSSKQSHWAFGSADCTSTLTHLQSLGVSRFAGVLVQRVQMVYIMSSIRLHCLGKRVSGSAACTSTHPRWPGSKLCSCSIDGPALHWTGWVE